MKVHRETHPAVFATHYFISMAENCDILESLGDLWGSTAEIDVSIKMIDYAEAALSQLTASELIFLCKGLYLAAGEPASAWKSLEGHLAGLLVFEGADGLRRDPDLDRTDEEGRP